MRKFFVISYLLLVISFFLAPPAFALYIGELINPFGNCRDLSCIAAKITGFLVIIAPAIATIMILVGAFQMITAGGDPKKFSDGKKTLLYAAVGLVVVLLAGTIINLVIRIFS